MGHPNFSSSEKGLIALWWPIVNGADYIHMRNTNNNKNNKNKILKKKYLLLIFINKNNRMEEQVLRMI